MGLQLSPSAREVESMVVPPRGLEGEEGRHHPQTDLHVALSPAMGSSVSSSSSLSLSLLGWEMGLPTCIS